MIWKPAWMLFTLVMISFLPFTLGLFALTGDPNAAVGNVLSAVIFVPFVWFCEKIGGD